MSKLKALGSHLASLPPVVGFVRTEPKTEAASRAAYSPWRRWYNTARWRKLRMATLIRDALTCQWPGCGHLEGDTALLVADHRTPHRGDPALFWDATNLWTLCKPCHDRLKQREERAAERP